MMRRQIEDYENGKVTKLDVYDTIMMVERAWQEDVTKATIENYWRHTALSLYVDNRPHSQCRDLDLNATLVHFNLNEQLNIMGGEMDDLRGGEPATLTINEWLEADDDGNMERYGPDEWLTKALVEEVVKDSKAQPEGDVIYIVVDKVEEDEEHPIMFREVEASIGFLKKFLQQASIDVFPFLRKLKVVDQWMTNDSILKRTQSTLH